MRARATGKIYIYKSLFESFRFLYFLPRLWLIKRRPMDTARHFSTSELISIGPPRTQTFSPSVGGTIDPSSSHFLFFHGWLTSGYAWQRTGDRWMIDDDFNNQDRLVGGGGALDIGRCCSRNEWWPAKIVACPIFSFASLIESLTVQPLNTALKETCSF